MATPVLKKCPDCAEEVRAEARKCRFCGFIFPESSDAPTPGGEEETQQQLSDWDRNRSHFWRDIWFYLNKDTTKLKAAQDRQIICKQCHSTGYVTTSKIKLKKGISGGKATSAILTGGLSLFAVGLSRKEDATEAKCSDCGSVWHF